MMRALRQRMLVPVLGALAAGAAFAQAPTISSVVANYASHVLTITGTNFGGTPTATFAGQSLTPTIVSPGVKLTVSVPSSLAAANYVLVVGNGSGTASFTLYYGPAAMTWKGAWSYGATYSYNDAVSWNGGSYLSRSNGNTHHQPDLDTSNWNVLASPPATPPHEVTLVSQGGTDTGTVKVLGLRYMISVFGIFPSSGGIGTNATYSSQIIGEIRLFAGNYEPAGWAFCDGRLLNIADYQALFTILGTQYGGDGITTFALPDLRAAVPVHANN